jgi:hypothetical protein
VQRRDRAHFALIVVTATRVTAVVPLRLCDIDTRPAGRKPPPRCPHFWEGIKSRQKIATPTTRQRARARNERLDLGKGPRPAKHIGDAMPTGAARRARTLRKSGRRWLQQKSLNNWSMGARRTFAIWGPGRPRHLLGRAGSRRRHRLWVVASGRSPRPVMMRTSRSPSPTGGCSNYVTCFQCPPRLNFGGLSVWPADV